MRPYVPMNVRGKSLYESSRTLRNTFSFSDLIRETALLTTVILRHRSRLHGPQDPCCKAYSCASKLSRCGWLFRSVRAAEGSGRMNSLREMGGAPRNPAPRNHFSAWIVEPSGCHCTDAIGGERYRRVPTPLRTTSPFSDLGADLSIYLSIYIYIYIHTYIYIYISIDLSIDLPVCLSVCLSIYLDFYKYMSIYDYIYIEREVCLSIHLSIYI